MENNENKFDGFVISRKQVTRELNGKVKSINIHNHEYARIILPSNINYGGILDKDNNPIHVLPEGSVATFLVPYKCVQNHRYDDHKSYVNVPKNYKFRISVDLGTTGMLLANGKSEHEWTYIQGVTLEQMKEFFNQNKFVSFTISKNQKGVNYHTQDGSERTTIIIPSQGKEYAGGRIACSPKCFYDIPGHPNIYQVKLPCHAQFSIQKGEIIGENPTTGKPVYGNVKIVGKKNGYEIAQMFAAPEKEEITLNKENSSQVDSLNEQGEDIEF